MTVYLDEFIESLLKKYGEGAIPHSFAVREVAAILKKKYAAEEIDVDLADIDEESRLNAIGYYAITDEAVLATVFSDVEKVDLYEMTLQEDQSSENEVERMWCDIQEGRRVNIILESIDSVTFSGFTLQGMSERLFHELNVLTGIHPAECKLGNEAFHAYLKSLVVSRYL
ncbi:hypothetical protein LCM10_05135 [Rossellomorea aquimaris]|uniref:hypothetical protein n=1 Tax=Rossellomorea aquimaris TaxID=189382 RepID=UPI001CD80420|nr:hypothetical protein [Rossellomorea aquimaris]MCA1054362.1 hypothetical protein [Rossellomorea aquimaris]